MTNAEAVDWLYAHRRLVPETLCWEYTGDTTHDGRFGRVSGNSVIAKWSGGTIVHRISAKAFLGFDGDRRQQWRQTCGNTLCFNYEHLTRKKPEERTCKDCGKTFPLGHEFFYGHKKSTVPFMSYCKDCMKVRIKSSADKRKLRDPEGWRALRQAYKRNRGAAKKSGSSPYRVNYDFVIERDQMTCHICKLPIESANDLHFDHIIPLSKGGIHANWNVACAHAKCNMQKYTSILPSPPTQLSFI